MAAYLLFSKKASSPTKQGELMAMSVPLICNDGVGDTGRVVRKYEAGVVVEHYSANAFQQAAKTFINTRFDAARLRQGAEEFFSLEQGVAAYEQVYRKVLG